MNIEKELRGLSDEKKVKRMGLVKIIMENNIKMLEIQKTIENIKRQKEGEIRKKEEKRARETRLKEEWRKIEKMRIKEERRTEKE